MTDGGKSAVNTGGITEEMSSQDEVHIIVGTWARGEKTKWIFETETSDARGSISLKLGMSYAELVRRVRTVLNIIDSSITVKLAYQYPEWVVIDDADGSTPEYITDDEEVDVFIEMRRNIEEVNLCVSVTKVEFGIVTDGATGRKHETEGEGTTTDTVQAVPFVGAELETEWHQFAMSDTPLTYPPNSERPPTTAVSQKLGGRRVPAGGITIREPEPIIRLRSPVPSGKDKGKGIATTMESDSESEEEDAVVPVLHSDRPENSNGGRTLPVRRQLFPETQDFGGRTTSETDDDGEGEWNDVPVGDQPTWGRFEEALHQMLTDVSSDPTLFGRDAPPVYESDLNFVDAALADVPYEGDKIYVGKVYKSKTDCKIKIAIHAINRRFHFRTTRSSTRVMVMQCVSLTCPWRVYAVLLDGSGNFQIRSVNLTHTCNVDDRRHYHRLATTQVIGEIMQSKFVGIKKGPSPAGIRKVMLDDYHVNVSYWKSWRSREIAMDSALGSMAGSYALLPTYLALLQNANPGTQCYVEHEEDPNGGTRFKYCFVAYGASIGGFPFMRKVIVIDGTSLKGRYGGCLVSACAQDANFQIFPLAFGVVDSENDKSWVWFLTKLSRFVEDSSDLVFISDRRGSIYRGLATVYPQAHHAACTVHLWRNVVASFRPRRLDKMMTDAAKEFTVDGFNKRFIEIQKLNPGCAAYLVDIGFEHWTRAHFKGRRYNIMDSNIAESWNAVIKEAREYPLICMLEYIRISVMSWFAIRRAKAMKNKELLTPNVKKLVAKTFEESTNLAVRMICDFEYQVQEHDGECHTVKLLEGFCSCMEFQLLSIPCRHAIAAAGAADMQTDNLVGAAFYGETWSRGFTDKIYPVPSVGGGELGGAFRGEMMPPMTKRPAGRPKKIRILSRGEFKKKKSRGRRCTRCHGVGHNRASCKHAI